MVPAGSVGAYTHWKLGNVRTGVLPGIIAGVLAGTWLGGTFAHVLPDMVLRAIFAFLLAWTGIRYLRTRPPQSAEKQRSKLQAGSLPQRT
jgi:uncharacterized membrane protein YfcA